MLVLRDRRSFMKTTLWSSQGHPESRQLCSFLFYLTLHLMEKMLLFFIVLLSFACKKGVTPATEILKEKKAYQFLDSLAATHKISTDNEENFFDITSTLEYAIQIHSKETCTAHIDCQQKYIQFLKEDVGSFSKEEKALMTQVMDSALWLVDYAFPNLEFPSIDLVKTTANHYGPSVYYTRENAIVIPYNELRNDNVEGLISVMLHEISHIVSRYHPSFKDDMYGLIGFKPMDKKLIYPQEILDIILKNPDGLNDRYYLELTSNDKTIKAVPIIVSNKSSVSEKKTGFMSYIKFDLYVIEESEKGYSILCNDLGYSTISPEYMASFFEQIKDNTQYIIHPDEIIADNFLYLVKASRDNNFERFSADGKILLNDIGKILRSYAR